MLFTIKRAERFISTTNSISWQMAATCTVPGHEKDVWDDGEGSFEEAKKYLGLPEDFEVTIEQ